MGEPGELTMLLRAAADGDAAAWNRIVERFATLLWSVARAHRLDTDDAADVVQNTWLRLLDHLDRIREPEALAGWLQTTARYESLSMLRRRGRERVVRHDDLAEQAVDRPSYAAVSASLGMPVGSIGPNRMRCLERLRRLLAGSDYDFRTGGAP